MEGLESDFLSSEVRACKKNAQTPTPHLVIV